MRNKFGESVSVTAKNGSSLEPAERKAWSRPITAEVTYLADEFRVMEWRPRSGLTGGYFGPSVMVRLEDDGRVYVSVRAQDDAAHSSDVTLDWDDFVWTMGMAFFGEGWNEAKPA